MRHRLHPLLLVLLVPLLPACTIEVEGVASPDSATEAADGSSAGPADASPGLDATLSPDAAVPPDASMPPDGSVPPDAAVPPDASVPPDGSIPPDASTPPDASMPPDAGPPPDAGIPTPWESRGVGGGGALFVPEVSPFDNQLYMATDMRSVFHSADFGRSWTAYDFRVLSGGAAAQVRFTSDPATLYALGVDPHTDEVSARVSTNGGLSFSPIAAISAMSLEVDPSSTRRLLVTDWDTLYFSDDGGPNLRSVHTTTNAGQGLILAGAFWDGTTIYVGTSDGLLVSRDNGATFPPEAHGGIPATEVIFSFAGAKAGTTTRFFAVTNASTWAGASGCEVYSDFAGVYRLETGGTSWTAATGIPAGHAPTFVRMARGNIDVAWLAGSDTSQGAPSVAKTVNGGGAWSSVFLSAGNANIGTGWSGAGGDASWGFGECAEGFAVSSADPQRAVLTDMGYVHLTSDGGASWHQGYVNPADENPAGSNTPRGKAYRTSGVEQTSGWWLTWPDATTIIGSLTDIRGIRSTDSGVSWTRDSTNGLSQNTTYQALLHPSGTVYAPTSTVHDLYMSYRLADAQLDPGGGTIVQSTNKGASWTVLHDFGHPVVFAALDPSDPRGMYASVVNSTQGGIYRTTQLDQGTAAAWSRTTSPARTEGHPYDVWVLSDGTVVATFSGRRTTVFTDSSGVFVSTDHGATWADRSDAAMHYWTKDLVVDPSDPTQDTWYVGVAQHWGAGGSSDELGLYRTTNRGQAWTRIWSAGNVESCTIDPSNPDRMFVTTENDGLWVTTNLRSATPTFSPDLDYPFVHPLRVFFNPFRTNEVWVASFGGGLRVRSY